MTNEELAELEQIISESTAGERSVCYGKGIYAEEACGNFRLLVEEVRRLKAENEGLKKILAATEKQVTGSDYSSANE